MVCGSIKEKYGVLDGRDIGSPKRGSIWCIDT